MSYSPYYTGGWQNLQSGATPLNKDALNHMEAGIAAAAVNASAMSFKGRKTTAFDMNGLTETGFYMCEVYPDHSPFATEITWFVIEVLNLDSMIEQRVYYNAYIFRRIYASGAWSSWYRITNRPTAKIISNRTTGSYGNISLELSSDYAVLGCDTISYNGTYYTAIPYVYNNAWYARIIGPTGAYLTNASIGSVTVRYLSYLVSL